MNLKGCGSHRSWSTIIEFTQNDQGHLSRCIRAAPYLFPIHLFPIYTELWMWDLPNTQLGNRPGRLMRGVSMLGCGFVMHVISGVQCVWKDCVIPPHLRWDADVIWAIVFLNTRQAVMMDFGGFTHNWNTPRICYFCSIFREVIMGLKSCI
jgi:hypothetical protein